MYKIKVFECNVKAQLDDDYQKAVEYFKSHNIDVVFERNQTNVKLLNNAVEAELALPNDGKYDCVMYLYERLEQPNNGYSYCIHFSTKMSLIKIPTGLLEDPSGFHWYTIAHEIMHSFFQRLQDKGVNIVDPMDSYIENTNPYSTTGNFAEAWKRLAPHLDKLFPPPPIENYFKIQEFVPKAIYQQYGEKSIWFIDPRIQKLANFTRKFFGRSVTINNWLWNGSLNQRGFREPESTVGGKLSQHRLSRAIDINVAGMTPKAVYDAILLNEKAFMEAGLTCMEDIADTPAHTHLDIRQTGLNKILIVKP